jgi:hypothetical protein
VLIDQTRYDAFWRNPERYRLTYELNLVPKTMQYGLARGTAFHLIAEERARGRSKEEIDAILRGQQPGTRGPVEPIEEKAIEAAWVLWNAMEAKYPRDPNIELVASELEFMYQIPGSPHYMVGRIDQVLARNGELWCGEFKTANARARYDKFVEDWKQKAQADFEIVGAHSFGYKVEGVWVRQVVETTPPTVWELEERRSQHRLQVMMLNVHQTCEIITMMKATFGINQPWPHLSLSWPCSMGGKCEYETICQQDFEALTPNDLESFKQREEHLDCVRKWKEEHGAEGVDAQLLSVQDLTDEGSAVGGRCVP